MDTRDLHVHVSRAKRTRCYAEVVTFLRVNLGFDVLTKISRRQTSCLHKNLI